MSYLYTVLTTNGQKELYKLLFEEEDNQEFVTICECDETTDLWGL